LFHTNHSYLELTTFGSLVHIVKWKDLGLAKKNSIDSKKNQVYAKIKQLIIFTEESIANALFYWLNKSFLVSTQHRRQKIVDGLIF
jgi:hypothetical protein